MAVTAAGAAVTSILAGEGSGVTSGVVSEVAGGALCCNSPASLYCAGVSPCWHQIMWSLHDCGSLLKLCTCRAECSYSQGFRAPSGHYDFRDTSMWLSVTVCSRTYKLETNVGPNCGTLYTHTAWKPHLELATGMSATLATL